MENVSIKDIEDIVNELETELTEEQVRTVLMQFNRIVMDRGGDWADIIKGFIVAAITAIVTGVYTIIQGGAFPSWSQLGTIALTGLAAGLAYLIKNVFTNSTGQTFTSEKK